MVEFYVALTGDDAWPGTAERPFATITRAREAARAADGDVVVNLRAGTHVTDRALQARPAPTPAGTGTGSCTRLTAMGSSPRRR